MSARSVWLTYCVIVFIIVPIVFRARYGRWPFAGLFPPRERYGCIDWSYAFCLAAYTVWLLLRTDARAVGPSIGHLFVAAGLALQLWAVASLAGNWRIGQDRAESDTRFVLEGPFRYMRHPIYIGLVVVAIGQMLLAGFAWPSLGLVILTVVYSIVQGRSETRFWQRRGGAE